MNPEDLEVFQNLLCNDAQYEKWLRLLPLNLCDFTIYKRKGGHQALP